MPLIAGITEAVARLKLMNFLNIRLEVVRAIDWKIKVFDQVLLLTSLV